MCKTLGECICKEASNWINAQVHSSWQNCSEQFCLFIQKKERKKKENMCTKETTSKGEQTVKVMSLCCSRSSLHTWTLLSTKANDVIPDRDLGHNVEVNMTMVCWTTVITHELEPSVC